jgi:hypothetical protein
MHSITECRTRAAEYERKAEMIELRSDAERAHYRSLAQYWRSLALLADDRSQREQSGRKVASY